MSAITSVFLDVGETLVDETRLWNVWADWLGVGRSEFMGELSDIIIARRHHREVFERFRPGFDVDLERRARRAAGWPEDIAGVEDFYPDALPCLRELRTRGYAIGIAGNQPSGIERMVHGAGLDVDVIASSEDWGVAKPSAAFFDKLCDAARLPPERIAYVGDRVDNDVLPAVAAGMIAIHVRRGPWGVVHAEWPEAARAHARIDSLAELPAVLDSVAYGSTQHRSAHQPWAGGRP